MIKPDDRNSTTRLGGLRQNSFRALWFLLVLSAFTAFVVALPLRYEQLLKDPYNLQTGLEQLGLSIHFFAVYGTALDIVVATGFLVIGTIIFSRKMDDWLVAVVSLALSLFTITILPVVTVLPESNPAWTYPVLALRAVGTFLLALVFYTFPDGRFIPKWTRWFLGVGAVYILAWFINPDLIPPTAFTDIQTGDDTIKITGMIIWFVSVIVAQTHRYRHIADARQRQQTKWVLFGTFVIFLVAIGLMIPLVLFPGLRVSAERFTIYILIAIPTTLFAFFLLPLTIAFAILRYRLWEIETLFNRTLVYGALTATLAIVYFVSIVVLQQIFPTQSQIATVVSTLAIAALFSPLRRRIQRDIDRLFYRRKYDATRAIDVFNQRVRNEVDLERLSNSLLAIVEETMQPGSAELWLRELDNE